MFVCVVQLAKKYHPDRNKGDKETAKKFTEIGEAYEVYTTITSATSSQRYNGISLSLQVLSDEKKRQMYDATGHSQYTQSGFQGAGGSPFTERQAEEIFSQFFSGGGFGSIFGQAFETSSNQIPVHLTFNEAVRGCEKEISVRVQASCDRCFGSGGEPGTKEQMCPYCRGTGEVGQLLSVPVSLSLSLSLFLSLLLLS